MELTLVVETEILVGAVPPVWKLGDVHPPPNVEDVVTAVVPKLEEKIVVCPNEGAQKSPEIRTAQKRDNTLLYPVRIPVKRL